MSDIVKRVEELLKLPQELCKTCGKCCRIATFKEGLTYEEVLALSQKNPENDDEAIQIDGAKDFLTIFKPYKSIEKAKEYTPEFVKEALKRTNRKENEITFFYCRYIDENNLCKIHEDRPHLCRMYPIPHYRTLFNPRCGFEEQAKKNWEEIEQILKQLDELSKPIKIGEKNGNH